MMITNKPIPDNAEIVAVVRGEWDGRPALVTRYLDGGREMVRMDWVDELDTRPDSIANYLRTTPTVERQHT